ncbi:Uncharacterized protein dnm_071280 [Desulfonema magnum]|uniref:Uncharacterized protein n=1 Tax=Desulfonema magnum TaxID=45655 RepID=A0A975GSG6_9BACT|nr:Uncharacterized protein dnm_071280 [Desulfonema magnum]
MLNIDFKKTSVTPECRTCSLAIFLMPGNRTLLPNCKFGTPDNLFLKAYSLNSVLCALQAVGRGE